MSPLRALSFPQLLNRDKGFSIANPNIRQFFSHLYTRTNALYTFCIQYEKPRLMTSTMSRHVIMSEKMDKRQSLILLLQTQATNIIYTAFPSKYILAATKHVYQRSYNFWRQSLKTLINFSFICNEELLTTFPALFSVQCPLSSDLRRKNKINCHSF